MLDPTEHGSIYTSADHDLLLLGPTRVERLRRFRQDIRSCDGESARYSLCLAKRNELLEKQDELLGERVRLHIEFASYEPEFAESTTYRATREKDSTWRKFATDAAVGRKSQARWTTELKSAAARWGEEIVYYYAGKRGVNFAVEFARTARKHPDWGTDALPRFQQLVCRRIQLIKKYGRHSFMHPLERIDLVNARLWDAKFPYVKQNDPDRVPLPLSILHVGELPYGYGLDQYGLLVPKNPAFGKPSQVVGSTVAADPMIDTASAGNRSAVVATGHAPSTRNIGEDAANGTYLNDISHANDTHQFVSDPLQSRFDLSQPVDRVAPGYLSGAEAIAGSGGNESVCLPAWQQSNGDMSDMGHEYSSPHNSSPITPRRSARMLAKRNVVQDIEKFLANAPTPPRARGRRHGNRHRRSVKRETQHAATAGPPEPLHVDWLKILAGRLPTTLSVSTLDSSASLPTGLRQKRAASVPRDASHDHAAKQHRIAGLGLNTDVTFASHNQTSHLTTRGSDDAFLAQAKREVNERAGENASSRGTQTAMHLLPVLQNCKHPNSDGNKGPIEVHHLSGQQAKELLSATTPDVPIVTEKQQQFKWSHPTQPMAEFFEWMEDLDRMVFVQIPSLAVDRSSYERHSLRQVRERLLSHGISGDPWNILDCRCPLPSVLPGFLTSWNCQLLARIREMVLNADGAERATTSRDDWLQWRDIEHWALLSEGGHCTAPHIDSHGLATWNTIQEGMFGFAWMSRPTDEQRTKWMEDTEYYDEGQQWRFLILKSGQTIFFPSGTIHAVFRVQDTRTLALGGHLLQWTGVSQWAETISKQTIYPDSVNEDMSDVWKWIPVVESLLRKRLQRSESSTDWSIGL